ncbi:hypothetical protein RIF29_38718 [Crotalaria pallida]|uniref:CCHC-type domain-containing protein n=1 Tax=Crotalaria pallida TaxID=3830 RepID=A0AAN9E0I9_CROPI
MSANPLLGFIMSSEKRNEGPSIQEEDQKERSNKKVKVDGNDTNEETPMDLSSQHESDAGAVKHAPGNNVHGPYIHTSIHETRSYKNSLLQSIGVPSNEYFEKEDEDLPENRWYKEDSGEENDDDFDPCPEIEVSKEEYDEWCMPWRSSLIVNLFGKRVNAKVIENKIKRDWVKKGSVKIIDMPKDYFLVHFSSEEDYNHALFEGPWKVADHYLIVQRWRPFFMSTEQTVRKIAVWVRLPNLPIELYNPRFLWKVGRKIGTMLKVDSLTSLHSRGKFARICVEIDLNKKLIPQVKVCGSVINLEYEGLHLICFNCGKYGHKMDSCTEIKTAVATLSVAVKATGDHQMVATVEDDSTTTMETVKVTNDIVVKNAENQQKQDMVENVGVTRKEGGNTEGNRSNLGTSSDNIIESSPFGPWMMVKNPPRFKGKSHVKNTDSDYVQQTRGSRFSSLRDLGESEDGLKEKQQVSAVLANPNSNQLGREASPKRSIKVRDPTAGKNSQSRATKNFNQQTQNLKGKPPKNIAQPATSVTPVSHASSSQIPETPNRSSTESQQLLKEKEQVILLTMRVLEKQGIGTIDNFCTRVFLPSSSEVTRVHTHSIESKVTNLLPEPPDIRVTSMKPASQKASMEVDGCRDESSRLESLGIESHISIDGLQDQPQ